MLLGLQVEPVVFHAHDSVGRPASHGPGRAHQLGVEQIHRLELGATQSSEDAAHSTRGRLYRPPPSQVGVHRRLLDDELFVVLVLLADGGLQNGIGQRSQGGVRQVVSEVVQQQGGLAFHAY